MNNPRVILLGTGSARFSLERAAPALAVLGAGTGLVVDCGEGVMRQVVLAGLEPARMTGLLLTRLDAEHTLGYGGLVLGGWSRGRRELQVCGPPGTIAFHRKLLGDLYAADLAFQQSLGMAGSGLTDARLLDLHDAWQGELGELRVQALPVRGPFPSLAYRFDLSGGSVVVSGDAAYSPELVELARDADLLVQAATVSPSPLGPLDSAERLYTQLGGHPVSPERAGKLAKDAGVRHLVLTHLLPGADPDDLSGRAATEFGGRITIGDDLREFVIGG
jgi:ribonuclease BN (tRNA processing enzyme)